MISAKPIGYKRWCEDMVYINDDGYFTKYDYRPMVDGTDIYCVEVNIINRIKVNDEGLFDFSKAMIDIGAEFGKYSFILDFAHNYMFEGNKEKAVVAQMNMLLHDKLDKSTMYNVLLSDKNEQIKYDGFCTENTISDVFEYDAEGAEPTKAVTLDSFGLENIGFIKIDVECMEYQVLKGGIGTIVRNNYPPILFELWDVGYFAMTQEVHDRLVKFLTEDLGYEILWYWGDHETHLAIHK